MTHPNFTSVDFGMVDVDGFSINEGDVVIWQCDGESVVCQIFWDPSSFAFKLKELNGTDPMFEVTNIRLQGEYLRLGNEFDTPGIVKKWNRLKDFDNVFLKQGEPNICFPLAALNACAGAGIVRAYKNFNLLNKMIKAGECREWGGCVNERGALNAIQSEVEVEFVQAEMEDVLENGGILTLKEGGFHACAVIIIDGDSYLVNSNLEEGQFIRPILCLSEITMARSDDPEHHRDYLLVKG